MERLLKQKQRMIKSCESWLYLFFDYLLSSSQYLFPSDSVAGSASRSEDDSVAASLEECPGRAQVTLIRADFQCKPA